MGARRKTNLSKMTRNAKMARERRARQRLQMWIMEQGQQGDASTASSAETTEEPIATSVEMEENWNAFSIAVTRSKKLNAFALDVYRKKNNHVGGPQAGPAETSKEEVKESLLDSKNIVQVTLELETKEKVEKKIGE